ncbi:2-C-methyl-D-erythritol 2,4-cyclodiphosphate synthase [Pirellula sp. SH-Sr6A]|uniref:2-C-methyl-D-erythritol 2,4-cyclodiphosphate synthase n=1 Tax=Pirellula sp. SH-Sr6A TaxID=1632865 RepID=UPI00078CD554|nr:2-C-methyl-D-erythritol 2,4-cyclodiphosphate synthase [Pirellula sp. SH-Sr6A]AMV33987.1 2-C-methyl-D-erythritol 2,4-cyclodiphosphate synthase [Pirellula sp. SH-Sr6A]
MNPYEDIRIGLGTDSHRIEAGGPMILGGISIDYPAHFVGHSDADVLLHAITDAILSAAGLPDIGELFPNDREENRGRDSGEMLSLAVESFRRTGWRLSQIDCVVELEKPKISPWKDSIQRRISEILQIPSERVRVKGKTGEGVGEVGTGKLGKAICIALACRNLALDDN